MGLNDEMVLTCKSAVCVPCILAFQICKLSKQLSCMHFFGDWSRPVIFTLTLKLSPLPSINVL